MTRWLILATSLVLASLNTSCMLTPMAPGASNDNPNPELEPVRVSKEAQERLKQSVELQENRLQQAQDHLNQP
jgi:hypothetical protein